MIIIRDIPFNQISIIKNLWEKNRKYHENISKHFGFIYSDLVFEDRIKSFSVFDTEQIKISVAESVDNERLLGYCISTFEGTEGETQTLHVDENERNTGIGKRLMDSHIAWMKNNGCKTITIIVAVENTNTLEFYKTLGFKANTLEMKLI